MSLARILSISVLLPAVSLAAPPTAAAPPTLSPAEQTAAFRAAGFKRVKGQWQGCGDPGTPTYTPGAIEQVLDFNGDGRPEAVVTEGSLFCFGRTEVGYTVVSKQADGSWKQITAGPGIVTVLPTPKVVLAKTGGWPDLEIGGPGFCFPVERWNGREYALHRRQYEGKPCRG